jgi:hypothetical protein
MVESSWFKLRCQRCIAGTNELYDAKAEAFLEKKHLFKSIYYCGDKLVEVKGASQSTAYKSD